MTDITLAGIVPNLPEAEYFASSALSSTGARKLLDSPARFHYWQSHPEAPKSSFDLGAAVHSRVLGTGYDIVAIPAELLASNGAASTKAAKEFIEQVRSEGRIPVKQDVADEVSAITEAILAQPVAKLLFEQAGTAEASVFATDPETGVDLRARFDFLPDLNEKHPIAVDVKTTAKSAHVDEFSKTVANFGYDVQDAHYDFTHHLVTGVEIPLVFVVVETLPPYLVGLHQLPLVWREMGQTKARRARELFAQCTATDTWPGYPTEVQLLTQPTWAVYQDEERYA